MSGKFINGAREIGVYLARTYRLAKPYWYSEEKLLARGLLFGILAITGGQLYLSSTLSYTTADLFDALDNRNVDDVWKNLYIWAALLAILIVSYMIQLHMRYVLIINWRRFLTEKYLDKYLNNGLFNQLELKDYDLDNPDQRISADMFNFANETLELGVSFLTNIGGFFVFSSILWTVSGSLPLVIGGVSYIIPGYMFWVAVIYAILLTWATHKIGRPLVRLNFKKQAVEADFRYHLVRLRENAESVALSKGEKQERGSLSHEFDVIRTNWLELLRYQKRLLGLNYGVSQLSGFFPYIAAMPALFAGTIAMGGFIQLRGAFGAVEATLSWFAHSYEKIAIWKASVDRILTLDDAIEKAEYDRHQSKLLFSTSAEDELHIQNLSVKLPTHDHLVTIEDVRFESGKDVIITGRSGSGKSTLFRVLSGQWVWADGTVVRPEGPLTFLPQKPYFPIATLRAALTYPEPSESFDSARLTEILHVCQMGSFADRLDEHADWARILSGGEQQRMAIARAILSNPKWLFLDEATSAMDSETEATIYQQLKAELPDTTIVSIAHRPSLKDYHDIQMRLEPETKSVSIIDLPPVSPLDPTRS